MKKTKREQLRLEKITIQDLDGNPDRLESDEQKAVKGGEDYSLALTRTPVYC